MKKIWIVCLVFAVLLGGCATGVPQQEYNSLQSEHKELQQRFAEQAEELEQLREQAGELQRQAQLAEQADEPAESQDVAPPDDEAVFVSESGAKYHKDGCRFLKSKRETTYNEAVEQGYEPCAECFPQAA